MNGSIPGPTLFADWNDEVVVHVFNNLTKSDNDTDIHFHNGISMYFHEIRENYMNPNDGVVSLTQCPIAPKETMTYE